MLAIFYSLTSWIDKKKSNVDSVKRLFAYVLDWIIGGVCTSILGIVIFTLVSKIENIEGQSFADLYMFPALGLSDCYAYITGLVCVCAATFYYIYIPYKCDGQTIGKKIMGLRIVTIENTSLTLTQYFKRQFLGLFIIEGSAVLCGAYIQQVLVISTLNLFKDYFSLPNLLSSVAIVITMISAVLAFNTPSQRSVHDYLAKTKVVNIEDLYKIKKG